MRPSDLLAAPRRRGKLARALAMATALLTTSWLAPEAAAARAGKAQASHAQPSHAHSGKPQAARGAPSRRPQAAATRTSRQVSRHGPAKAPHQAVAAVPSPAPAAVEDIPGVRRVVVSALDGAIRSTGSSRPC